MRVIIYNIVMSLNILLSNCISTATDVCLKKLLEHYSLSKNYIVITTDRNTLFTERKLLEMLPVGGATNIDVLTFSRLSSRYIDGAKISLTPEGSVLLMSKAITMAKDKLCYYGNSVSGGGFVRDMYTTVTALRNCSVTVDTLAETAEKLPTNLAAKASDIALIYQTYLELLSKSYYDGTSRLEAFGQYLEGKNPFYGKDVYITGFSSFNGQSLALIDKLVTRAETLTIALPSFARFDNVRLYPLKTLAQIREIFSRYDEKVNEELHINSEPFSVAIEKKLFSYEKLTEIESGNLEFYSAKSIFSEIEFIAYSIRKAVKNEGIRYKQITVSCPSIEMYRAAFTKYFSLYHIPFHIDEDEAIGNHCFIKLIDGIFETVLQNFKRESLFKLLKNPLLQFSFDDITGYENFATEFDVNYGRFTNIDSFSSFSNFDKIRDTAKIVADFIKLIQTIDDKKSSEGFVNALYFVLESLDMENRIAEVEQSLFDDGDLKMKEMSKHIFDKVKELFKIIVMINGDVETNLRDCYQLFKNAVKNEKMVLLPVSNDCVVIRSVENTITDGTEILYICGASEGSFPPETAEQTIITLKEASILHKNNCPFEPTQKDNAINGRFNILGLLMSSYNKLVLTYSEGLDGNHSSVSHIASRLASIFGVSAKRVDEIINFYAIADAKESCFDILGTEENAKKIFLTRIISAQGGCSGISIGELAVYDGIYNALEKSGKITANTFFNEKQDDTLQIDCVKLFFDKGQAEKKVSVSELEKYFSCPRKHFFNYGLSANPTKTAEIGALDIGNIVHDILKNFFTLQNYMDLDVKKTVATLLAKCDQLKVYFAKENDKTVDIMLGEIKAECVELVELMLEYENGSDFRPKALEQYFETSKSGAEDLCAMTPIGNVYFHGKIDRIDSFGNKLILFDYKTGKADSKLANIYYGSKIQLYFYMKCLLSDGTCAPAGAFYIPMASEYVKENTKRKPFVGYAVFDEKTLKQIDKNAMEGGKFVSLAINKDGSYSKNNGSLLTDVQFRAVCDYTALLVKIAISEISDGYILEKPTDRTCQYCAYAPCCKVNVGEKSIRQTVKSPTADNFVELTATSPMEEQS